MPKIVKLWSNLSPTIFRLFVWNLCLIKMLTKGQDFFPYWTIQLKICNFFCAFPYKWDESSEKVKLIKNKLYRLIYTVTIFLPLIYMVVMGIFVTTNLRRIPISKSLKGFVGILCYGISSTTRVTFWIWELEGLKLINGILTFEKNLIKGMSISGRVRIVGNKKVRNSVEIL